MTTPIERPNGTDSGKNLLAQILLLLTGMAVHTLIEAYKKGIKRTQIAKTFGMSRRWVWKVLRAFEKHGEEAAIAGHSRGPSPKPATRCDASPDKRKRS